MALSKHILKELALLVVRLEKTLHGKKEAIYLETCKRFEMSRPTLLRHLKTLRDTNRKQRSDTGNTSLLRDEAVIISAYCCEGYRKSGQKITSLKEAVDILRENKKIKAGRTDEKTGKFTPLSDSAIANALRKYVLHPDQLMQLTPHTSLRSLHPNHVWQVDASVCVLYYLNDTGHLEDLNEAIHYKNKPENLKAIERKRIIRYVVTDHTSGVTRYRYYPHAESGEHTVRFLAWAMAKKGTKDPFHGAPFIVMVDPGATSGGLVKRFCKRMGIQLIVNKAHNPRAKGSVEKGNHLIETSFEQTLKFLKPRPANFEVLNELAEKYQLWWNSVKIHSRTKKTRFEVWRTIKKEHLRTTPSAKVLLSLATEEPISRKVNGDLTVNFKNRVWDVQTVPDIYIGSKVLVHWHPFMKDTAMAVVIDENSGHEKHIALTEIKKDEYGFKETSAVINNQDFKDKPDTIADTNRKETQRLAAGTTTLKDTEKKRKDKNYIPFDGEINPLLKSDEANLPYFLPQQSVELELNLPNVELRTLNIVQAAKFMLGRLGSEYEVSVLHRFKALHPDGATELVIETFLTELESAKAQPKQPILRRVA